MKVYAKYERNMKHFSYLANVEISVAAAAFCENHNARHTSCGGDNNDAASTSRPVYNLEVYGGNVNFKL